MHWVDSVAKRTWYSVGTASVADWIEYIAVGGFSHTQLLDKGTNTHVQIDSHISSTSNPHSVTHTQVGSSVAQWNASQFQGRAFSATAPSNLQVITWNSGASTWEPQTIAASDQFLRISATDTTSNYLNPKINVGSTKLTKTIVGGGGNEVLELDVDPAQISHTTIGDRGTNTHAQIDSHITATNAALALKSNIADVLVRTNTDVYTPTTNYHPATKKYVDDNAGGIKPAIPLNLIAHIAGRYYPLQKSFATSNGTIAGAANRIDLYPVVWSPTVATVDLNVHCSTAVAASNVKILVYDSDAAGLPTTLIHESAALATATTGIKASAFTTQLTAGKIYWVGVRHSSTATLAGIPIAEQLNFAGIGTAAALTIGGCVRRTLTFATAAPSTWVWNAAEITAAVVNPAVLFRV
jgi:hypothetical protein